MTNMRIAVLAYHEISAHTERNKAIRSMGPSCSLSIDKFANQLSLISASNNFLFNEINVEHKMQLLNNKIIITFDDGHIGNFFFAFPALIKYNLKGVFFITTNFINQNNMMSWKQIKEMSDLGMSIQSHCVTHTPLETLSVNKVKMEFLDSKKIIEDETGKEVNAVSLPHGSIHPFTKDLAYQAGYKYVCTSRINYFNYNIGKDIYIVPRIPISDKLSVDIFRGIIGLKSKAVMWWMMSQALKYGIRKMVGINNYRRMYRLIHKIKIT